MVPRQHRSIASVKEQVQGIVELSTVPSSPFSRHVFLRRGSQFLVMGIPVVLLLLFVLYPLAAIILQSIFPQLYAANPSLIPSLDALKQVTASHENYLTLFNSLWLCGVTADFASFLCPTPCI